MRNTLKKAVAMVAALAVAFTAVVVTDVTTAEAAEYDTLYLSSAAESAVAGVEQKYPIEVSKTGDLYFTLYTQAPVNYTITIYNSAGTALDINGNPFQVSSGDSRWTYVEQLGLYAYDDGPISLSNGDYTYAIKFDSDTQYMFQIDQEKASAKISQTKATITTGFTKKLTVSGSKVTKWSSNKKTVATVDAKGKVTAKKTGKATISAKCENGQTVKCVVTVKANKYSKSRPTTSDVSYGSCAMSAYSASFDSKGNLVIKTRFVNNDYYKVSALENIKIVVRDGNGKLVGQYKAKKKSVSIPSHSTKDMSFTIKKADLKKKKADLRNCKITCDGTYVYYY